MGTLTVSRSSWFIRLFVWAWEADPKSLNICKLFWGILFLPFPLLYFKGVYRWIPLITFALCGYALLMMILGMVHQRYDAILAALLLFLSAVLAILANLAHNYYSKKIQPGGGEREIKNQVLTGIAQKGTLLLASLDGVLNPLPGISFSYVEGSFVSVVVEFFHGVKQRYCPQIRVL